MNRRWAIVVGGAHPTTLWGMLNKGLGPGYSVERGSVLVEKPHADTVDQFFAELEKRRAAFSDQHVWVHVAGVLSLRRSNLVMQLSPNAREVLQLNELAYELGCVPASRRMVLLELTEDADRQALERLSELEWPALTLGVAGRNLVGALRATLTEGPPGPRTARELARRVHAFSRAGGDVLGHVGSTGATEALDEDVKVYAYLKALERTTQYVPSADLRDVEGTQPEIDEVYVEPHIEATRRPDVSAGGREVLLPQMDWLVSDDRPGKVTLHEAVADHRFLFLEGAPGSGKSTFVCRLAWEMCRHVRYHVPRPEGVPEHPFPVLVTLQDYAVELRQKDEVPSTANLLEHVYRGLKMADCVGDVLPQKIARKRLGEGGVLLLDGLDEVPSPELRRDVAKTITRLAQEDACLRIIVTCRPAAAKAGARPEAPFVTHAIAPFDEGERFSCATRWLERRTGDRAEAEAQARRLLAELGRHEGVDRHARTPLGLNIVALLFYEEGHLPKRRSELYERLLRRLVEDPNRPWEGEAAKIPAADRIRALKAIAWHWRTATHQRDEEGTLMFEDGCAEAVEKELKVDRRTADDFIRSVEVRTGLLRWRDMLDLKRRLDFMHRTFAEYLIAGRLAEASEVPRALLDNAADADWREIALLYVGIVLGGGNRPKDAAYHFITWLVQQAGLEDAPDERRSAHGRLAAECLADHRATAPERVIQDVDALQELFRCDRCAERFSVRDRVGFWEAIGVHAREFRGEVSRWIEIPAGVYWQGAADFDEEAADDEKPGRWCRHERFFVQRWPVIVSEMAEFMRAGGYESKGDAWWPDGGRWRCDQAIEAPVGWHDQVLYPSRPVVGISWLEAYAYTQWLSHAGLQRAGLPDDFAIHLPSEAQWEAAARGVPRGAPNARVRYPWGDAFDENLAHDGGRAGYHAIAVGAFAVGAGAGARPWDMAGQVWEWCLDAWGASVYAEKAVSTNGVIPAPRNFLTDNLGNPEERRVARGGSFGIGPWGLRVSCRLGLEAGGRGVVQGYRVAASVLPRTLEEPAIDGTCGCCAAGCAIPGNHTER